MESEKPIVGEIISTITAEQRTVFAPAPAGAFVKVTRTEREMKTYAFTDGELSTIGMFNSVVNIAIAIGGVALGVIATGNLERTGLTLSLLVVVACVAIGWWAARRRTSEVDRIKSESRPIVD